MVKPNADNDNEGPNPSDQDQDQDQSQQEEQSGSGSAIASTMQQRLFSGSNNRSLSLVKLPANGLIGPFNEDSELELVCVAHGGKPRPELSWRRDFSVLNSTTQFASLDKDGTSVALRIEALHRQHLLSIFTCQASNNNLTSPLKSSLTLDLNCKFGQLLVIILELHLKLT